MHLKIYQVSKTIPSTKPQNFVNISGAQKLTCAKFLKFEFFTWKYKVMYILAKLKSTWNHNIFVCKSYNEIVDKIIK